MFAKIDYSVAEELLESAVGEASDSDDFSVEWLSYAQGVRQLESKTWTPALGTMLLAKTLNSDIDAMSLKVMPDDRFSYSARGLCHRVLVPAAVAHGFSIRNTGREPLNNQPFFRYLRIDQIDRVRNESDYKYFLAVANKVNRLDSDAAMQALKAFLKVCFDSAAVGAGIKIKSKGLGSANLGVSVDDFLRADARDRPKRLQAFVAACLDLIFSDVKSRRINDPSRDLPGDVHVMLGGEVEMAVEVRGKEVTVSDAASFVAACSERDVPRSVLVVDSQPKSLLELSDILQSANGDMVVDIFVSARSFLDVALLWSASELQESIPQFVSCFASRLQEIEVTSESLEEWARAVSVARGRQVDSSL